jgi:hypothetical protein
MAMDLRRKQIDSLRELQLQMSEKSPNELYEVIAPINGRNLYFTIWLSMDFPSTPPIVYVNPKVRHPIVNESDCTLSVPSLRNWRVTVTLKSIVSEALTEFNRQPPIFMDMQPPPQSYMPMQQGYGGAGGYQPPFPPSGMPPPQQYRPPVSYQPQPYQHPLPQ